ncbi:MAG: SURF1 family protein [Pseudomonadales bacterium]|nr:SURF1 family protein [Pseudomonadales bacterium]
MLKIREALPINYFKNLYFSPSWALIVIGLFVGGVCCGFGFWQLDRAEEKTLLAERIKTMSDLPALPLNSSNNLEKFRIAQAVGRYLPSETFYLDNMIYKGRPGYHIISLFELDGKKELILVNRGWLAGLADRSVLPKMETPSGERTLKGSLVSPRTRPFFMGDGEPHKQKLRLYINIEQLSKRISRPVSPYVMQLQGDSEDGLIISWPKFDSKVSMHIGYAIQWFAFTLFALIMVIYSCFKKKRPALQD